MGGFGEIVIASPACTVRQIDARRRIDAAITFACATWICARTNGRGRVTKITKFMRQHFPTPAAINCSIKKLTSDKPAPPLCSSPRFPIFHSKTLFHRSSSFFFLFFFSPPPEYLSRMKRNKKEKKLVAKRIDLADPVFPHTWNTQASG